MSRPSSVLQLKKSIIKDTKIRGYDISIIRKAIKIAEGLHKDQIRKSGEPYIVHPLSVAKEILSLDLGSEAVAASILHDTIEDCGIGKEFLEREFNPAIADLVEGVTKIDAIADNSGQRYTAELLNLRKLIISSAADIRVILIKLADRLHNMRTIEALSPDRQAEYSEETLKVYVPLAEYLGIGKWKRELEDIAFRKEDPVIYTKIKLKIESDRRIHQNLLDQVIHDVNILLENEDLKIRKIYGRIKSVYSTYSKITKKHNEGKTIDITDFDFSKIKDLVAISVILDSEELECYKVLGLIHAKYEYLPKEFDDYIAKPKSNGYRSLQTTVKYHKTTVEIQIKTAQMHEVNEFGPASHLAYKLSGKRTAKASTQFGWIKNLTSWGEKNGDDEKYKVKAFEDKIFVITPKGRVIELKKGSMPIDFAYSVHTEVGNKFIGAKINGQIAKLDTKLENGDVVEILTSKNPKKPSQEWVKYAYMSSTRQKIRRYLTEQEHESNILKGRELISEYVSKMLKIDWLTLDSSIIRYICGELGKPDVDHLYLAIHHGNTQKKDIVKLIVKKLNINPPAHEDTIAPPSSEKKSTPKTRSQIFIEQESDLEYKIAGCCKPIFGDEIVGLVTLRDGLKIHRTKCPVMRSISEDRKLKAEWNEEQIAS